MRLTSAVFLVSSVMLGCITGSFEVSSSKVTEPYFPAKLRSITNDSQVISDVQSPAAHALANQEERMLSTPWPSLNEKLDSIVAKIVGWFRAQKWSLTVKDHTEPVHWFDPKTIVDDKHDSYQLAQAFWDDLSPSNFHALKSFFGKRNDHSATFLQMFSEKYGNSELLEAVLKTWDSEKTPRAKEAEKMLDGELERWIDLEYTTTTALKQLDILNPKVSASRRLKFLQRYIDLFNRVKGTRHTMLGTMIEAHGDEANLNQFLATVKKDLESADWITSLQTDMVNRWIKRKLPVSVVLSLLKLEPAQLYKPEGRDIVNMYVERLNAEGSVKTDLNSVLRAHFGDGVFADGIIHAPADKDFDTAAADKSKDWLFQQWREEFGDDKERLVGKIMEAPPARTMEATSARELHARFAKMVEANGADGMDPLVAEQIEAKLRESMKTPPAEGEAASPAGGVEAVTREKAEDIARMYADWIKEPVM